MAVVRDANASAAVEYSSTPAAFANLTVGVGTDRALVLQIVLGDSATLDVTSAVWDAVGANQALTPINAAFNATSNRGAELWGLVNPVSGNKTLTVAWTGGGRIIVNATSYIGVNQTGGTTTFPNSVSATGSGSSASTGSITSATGNVTIGVFGAPTVSHGTNQTELFFLSGAGSVDGGASEATSGTATHTWTIDSSQWAVVGTDIQAAGAGGPGLVNKKAMAELLRPFQFSRSRGRM